MFPANSKPRRPGALVQASHHRQGGHGTVAAAAVGLRGRRHAKGAVVALWAMDELQHSLQVDGVPKV